MISISSLADSFIPSVYVKNITLNDTFIAPVINKKNAGYYDPDIKEEKGSPANADDAMANMRLSIKFLKNANFQSEILQLLDTELSEYLKIYVHQITDKSTYQSILENMDKNALTTKNPALNVVTKEYTFKEVNIDIENLPEQTLDDGTTLVESVLETKFTFTKDPDFLAYIIVPAINHESLDEILLGRITADILILNGTFQNEGIIFKIAPFAAGSDVEALSKFGNPGDVWAGGVHEHNGRFMVGSQHTSAIPHPFLDYQIVSASKFVDNRVTKKIERNIINVTKTFEKVNSLTTRYTNSSLNLLDFESYKPRSFISDIFLSQDTNSDVQGAFVINKESLIRQNCAFPFIFDNANNAQLSSSDLKQELKELLDSAVLLKLNIYENDKLLATINNDSSVKTYFPKDRSAVTKMVVTKNNFNMKGSNKTDDFSFKAFNRNDKKGKLTYKVEVEYVDPTIEYVKAILPILSTALETTSFIIERAQRQKQAADGHIKSGFDPFTQKIDQSIIEEFAENNIILSAEGYNASVANAGLIIDVKKLADSLNFQVFFYNPAITAEQFKNYLYDSANAKTGQMESLMVLEKFLANLKITMYSLLDSFGAKPIKDNNLTGNQYGYQAGQGDVNSKLGNKVIKGESKSSIEVYDYGYDFTGFIPRNDSAMAVIKSETYKTACIVVLNQLLDPNGPLGEDALQEQFQAKGLPVQPVSFSAFSSLNIPVDAIKSCVFLPETVLNIDSDAVNVENIFTSIIKFNYDLHINNSTPQVGERNKGKLHKISVRQDLNSIFGNFYGASLNDTVTVLSDVVANSRQIPDAPSLRNKSKSRAANENEFRTTAAPNKRTSFIKPIEDSISPYPNNFILLSLLNKLLISQESTLIPKMAKPDFSPILQATPGSEEMQESLMQALWAPLQVKALSIDGNVGPFRDYLNSNQFYIEKGIINPLFLCYYWFIHQNLVWVQYLDKFKNVSDNVALKNDDNPYEINKSVQITTKNMKSPVWFYLTADKVNELGTGEKLLCRLVRYEGCKYVDKKLLEVLNLPLHNNYFILEGS
tara:strand:- start:7118 stop:10258 length:3141 start_codon:yes stop_codon:yes gene_type:complete